jgi:replicative DNA helicase
VTHPFVDRLPPFNQEAERAVLGAMLRDNEAIPLVVQALNAGEFYYDAHQKVYRAITEMYVEGRPVDLVLLADKLKLKGELADVGSYPYLAELYDTVPTSANAEYHAKLVKETALVRNLIHVSNETLRDAYDRTLPAAELLGQAERRILEIAEFGATGDTTDLKTALRETYDLIDTRLAAARNSADVFTNGVMTGYADLDSLTVGLRNSELCLIAARPSVGKTCLCMNLIRNIIVDQGLPVFMVSLEQSKTELAERLICAQAHVDSHKLRKGYLGEEEIERMMRAGDVLSRCNLLIDDTPQQNMLRISANARRLKLRQGIRVVFIDYLQLIDTDDKKAPRHEQVAQVSRRLKFLARELKIPVVALAQLNRSSEDRQGHKPRLADLRESGGLEADADTVFLLHRPEMYEGGEDNAGVIEIDVAKQRNGPTGEITLTYLKQFMRFENWVQNVI